MDGENLTSTNSHQWEIHQDGQYVGFASAAAYSPRLDWNISTALITVEAADSDGGLVVMCDDGPRNARPTSLPFRKDH